MGFLGTFSDFLTGSVGNNLDHDKDDVRNTKRNLKNTGHLDEEDVENGYATRELDEGIKSFQRDNSLKIDGTLLPGGETERGLFGTLTGRSADAVFDRKSEKNDGDIIDFGGNVSGISERKKPTYKRPKYSTVFVPPLDSEKEQTEKSNPFTITRGGMQVNKDKIADGIEKFLFAAMQGEAGDVPLPAKKLEKLEEEGNIEKTKEKKLLSKDVQEINDDARDRLKTFKKGGLDKSARYLAHYLSGGGEDIELKAEEIDSSPVFKKAIKTNQKRFEDSFAKGIVDRTYE